MKKNIRMLNKWSELTLAMKLDMEKVYTDETLSNEQKNMRLVSILTGEDIETIENLDFQDFCALATQLDFLKYKPEFTVPNKININGHKYRVVNDLAKVTTGQYFDLKALQKQYAETGSDDDLFQMIALFLVPEDKKGYLQEYELDDIVADVKDMPYAAVEGLMSFFGRCQSKFMKIILSSLLKQIPKKERKELKSLMRKNKISHTSLYQALARSQSLQN